MAGAGARKQLTLRLPELTCTKLEAWSAMTGQSVVAIVHAAVNDALHRLKAKDRDIIEEVVRARGRAKRARLAHPG